MKIEFRDDKTIVYLYRYQLSFDDTNKLTKEIKSIFVKLIKVYNLDLNGYLKVEVYCNKYYGYILVLENIYKDDDFVTIDLKLEINDDSDFYFKTNDYFILENYKNVYFDGRNFYINIKYIENLIKIIEYGEIVFEFDKKNCKLIQNNDL